MVEMDIDQLVREVLSHLNRHNGSTPTADNVTIVDRVISLELLKNQVTNSKKITVPSGAVVTPAAQDFLTENNIAVATVDPGHGESPTVRLALTTGEINFDSTDLIDALRRSDIQVESIPGATVQRSTEQLAGQLVAEIDIGILLTNQTTTALCHANRHPQVRAARAGNVADVREAVTSIGVNLLVIAPQGPNGFELVRIIRELYNAGPPRAPAQFV